MPVLVTEKWSEYEFVQTVGGRRGFDVTGVNNATEALAALQNDMGVAFGASHDLDNSIAAERPVVATPRSPKLFEIQVNYIPVPQLGAGGGIATPIKWSWRSAPRDESTDIDASTSPSPITNTAGQPFQSDFTRTFNARILIARRFEVNYRSGAAEEFENSVNKNQITIPRIGTFKPGQLLLRSYEPQGEIESEAQTPPPVECVYHLEVRKGSKADSDGVWDGFKFRIRNEGFMGWYDDDGTPTLGEFVTAKGVSVAEPVVLDRDGKPIDSTIKVMKGYGEPGQPPIARPGGGFTDSLIEESSAGVVFLKFLKFPVKDFGPLALFPNA